MSVRTAQAQALDAEPATTRCRALTATDAGTWATGADQTIGANLYHTYTQGAATAARRYGYHDGHLNRAVGQPPRSIPFRRVRLGAPTLSVLLLAETPR